MLLDYTSASPLCRPIAGQYRDWYAFMETKVVFQLSGSEWHAMDHAARVLLLALILGHQAGVDSEGMDSLCLAAAFHDSRRESEWADPGHGARAADYYREFCRLRKLPVDETACFIMHYHDLDDAVGLAEIDRHGPGRGRLLQLYQIFKDADGLDRFRLGPHALDAAMLRTAGAPALIPFSRYILQRSRAELNGDGGSRPALDTTARQDERQG